MHYRFDKHFTLEQANAMIPHVQKLFAEVRALLKHRLEPEEEQQDKLAAPKKLQNKVTTGNGTKSGNGNGNGHGSETAKDSAAAFNYSGWSEEKRHEAAYRLLNALQSQGIVIQDVERGLIDFPAIHDGREVFLCYELSDGQSVSYFHDIEAGYAGRQKITETRQ